MEIYDSPRERSMQTARPRRERRKTQTRNTPAVQTAPVTRVPTVADQQSLGQSPVLFGLTEEDIAVLDDAVFDEVWQALGKVVRARAEARSRTATDVADEVDAEDDDDE